MNIHHDEAFHDDAVEVPVIPETPHIREQLDALQNEVVGPEIEDMADDELMEHIESINDETLEMLKEQDGERAEFQLKVYEKLLVLFEDVEPLIQAENFEEAEEKSMKFLDDLVEDMEGMGMEDEAIGHATAEVQDFINIYGSMVDQASVSARMKMELLSTGLDILPFVGGAKLMTEGVHGKTLAGKDLGLSKRLLHVAEGSMWLSVDTIALAAGAGSFGTGTAAVEAGAMAFKAPKAAKLLGRSAALMRATKGAGKGSKALFNASRFLVKHPNTVGRAADKLVARGVTARRAALMRAPKEAAQAQAAEMKSQELIQTVNQEREEMLTALGDIFDAQS